MFVDFREHTKQFSMSSQTQQPWLGCFTSAIWLGPALLLPHFDGDLASAESFILVQLMRLSATHFRSTIMVPPNRSTSPRKARQNSCLVTRNSGMSPIKKFALCNFDKMPPDIFAIGRYFMKYMKFRPMDCNTEHKRAASLLMRDLACTRLSESTPWS